MIVHATRRRPSSPFPQFGQDDGIQDISTPGLFDMNPILDVGNVSSIPVGTASATVPAVNPITVPTSIDPMYSPIAPGLESTDLLPPTGTITVTSDGNIINSGGQILGTVNTSTGAVNHEPTLTAANVKAAVPAGTGLIAPAGLAANLASAINAMFGTKTVSTTAASPFGTPILAGLPNQYLIVGGVAIFALMLTQGRR
jgi:hypothetical protein